MKATRLRLGLAIVLLTPSFSAAQSGPSFDCSEATGAVQQTICADRDLAALDRELAAVWDEALPRLPEGEIETVRAFQRGWIKGRDECWKADDVEACVRDAYETRIAELQVSAGLVEVPDYHSFQCERRRPVGHVLLEHESPGRGPDPKRGGAGCRLSVPCRERLELRGTQRLVLGAPGRGEPELEG